MNAIQVGRAHIRLASDQSLLVYFGESITPEAGERVLKLLRLLQSAPLPAVRNLHPAYASLLIKFDPLQSDHAAIEAALRTYLERIDTERLPPRRTIEIPVCYGGDFGPDLADVSALHNLSPQQTIEAHSSALYSVCFLGFVPGFAYLAGLPESLATPRLSTPRTAVPAGSVGIAGHQTGVYPCTTPGGWRIIGRTPLQMFCLDRANNATAEHVVHAEESSLVSIGDRVRFTPISRDQFAQMEKLTEKQSGSTSLHAGDTHAKNQRFSPSPQHMNAIDVQEPGLLTTVQDLGREDFGPVGVSASGAADAVALRLGNRLVGNAENAAALEMTLTGGTFRFAHDVAFALTGSDFGATLNGQPVPLWESIIARAGAILRLGATRSGARCYLCAQGGIAVEPALGSASTHLLSALGGFHGRALRRGDLLHIGAASASFRKHRIAPNVLPALVPRKTLRVTPGPQADWFPDFARQLFHASTYRVAESSNRMGLRLEGPGIALASPREMLTEGVSLGAIQIPSGGQPIILFVEQQTTGGYPKIANVIAADLPSVGQLRPRDEIRFERVEFEAARGLLLQQETLLRSAVIDA